MSRRGEQTERRSARASWPISIDNPLMAKQGKPDHDATMMITPSMILPLPPAVPPAASDKVQQNDATMMLTADMIVNDESIVMGRERIERALAVVALWHVALGSGDGTTLLAMTGDDVELVGPRGTVRGSAAFKEWIDRAHFKAVPRRRFCGGEGTVVVEQLARWREHHGDVTAAIASAFVVRDGRIRRIEWFDELAMALTIYKLREVHEVTPRR
jgi:hypothetical protein